MAGTTNTAESVKVLLDRILQMDPKDINMTFLQNMFAGHHNRETGQFVEPNFKPTSKIVLTPQMYKYVKEPTETTLGILILNRYLLEQNGIIQYLGYQNTPIDNKGLNKLNTKVNDLVVVDKITTDDLVNYVDSRDRLGFWCAGFLTVSITPALLLPMENVNKRKQELFNQRKNDLESDNPVTQIIANNEIEKELMGIVRENLKDDSGYDFYRSGDGNLDNNYKTINVMRGAVFDEGTKKYHIVDSSLMQGIKPRDITPFANSIIAGAYPSAVGTAESGYMSKQLINLLQSTQLNSDPASDCGTQMTIPVKVTDDNKKYLIYRYIKENGKVKETTMENIDSYVGKTINMFSPQCCINKKICAKCAGSLFYRMGDNGRITNIGVFAAVITKKMLDLKLKSKHDLSQKASFMDVNHTFLTPTKHVTVTEDGWLKTNSLFLKLYIPKYAQEEVTAYYIEATHMFCLGIATASFCDAHGNEIERNLMTIPTMVDLLIYGDMQEDENDYILTYEPGSNIVSLGFQQNVQAVESYINLVYLHSKVPLIPYHLMTDMMFSNLSLNSQDIAGPSFVYELMSRALCQTENHESFALTYGKGGVDPLSYKKLTYREAVQQLGALQAILFEDISKGINVNLAATLNGYEPEDTPFDKILKA